MQTIPVYLPPFARVAVDRLAADRTLRTAAQLDELLDAYAGTYGEQCHPDTRAQAHHFCACRFSDFRA